MINKNTINRWGNDSLQNLKKVKPYCITKRQKCQCFSDRSFMCPKFKKNWKKYHSLNSCFWKRFLVHEVSSAFISSLVSWRIKYLHNSNIKLKQERLFLLCRRWKSFYVIFTWLNALLQYNMVQHRVSIHRRSSVVRLTTIKIPIKLEWEDEVRYRYM